MAQQTINIGAAPDDGTGDPVRDAFDKANQNFTELYGAVAALPEQIRDVIGAALVNGSNVTISVNDGADTITIAASGGGSGQKFKVRAATTANVTIATALNNGDTLDGITLVTDDLVLVKNQSSAEQNGIYAVGATPARAADYDTYDEHPGSLIIVEEGTTNADTLWLCTSNSGGTLDTTAIAFSQFTSGGGGGGTTKPFIVFKPIDNEPPSSNFASLDTRNGHPVLEFDTTTQEAAIFSGVLPVAYAGGGLTVEVYFAADTATSGTIGWDAAIERIDTSSLDIDADSFASAQTISAAAVPGTSGQILKSSVAFTSGAQMDSLAAGEAFRLRIRRDVANDTATGDAQLLRVVVRET
ncbi:hypothetical protein EH240_20080 [Mesorhizobium tamadayense]|uniref:Uncharacterized protein n=1 Tax=Mesorhizobium tamadayense TaxID=425306 RepID=A0A3P3FIN3_9HYPH|nr:hypothetical protein [Mesorhizobium tamadayense]RRH98096.1 hypothetical protein EH240_20080 [Mesorhizobium tamadayense]